MAKEFSENPKDLSHRKRLTQEARIQLVTQITAGLLASGHYTRAAEPGEGHDTPSALLGSYDKGSTEKPERVVYILAVSEAEEIVSEICMNEFNEE